MSFLEKQIQALEDFQNNTAQKLFDQIRKVEREVLQLNAQEQMFAAGQRADGTDIAPPYTPFTIRTKGYKGQPTDRVTLRDTGDFHRSLAIEYGAEEFTIVATDRKEARLRAKYGDEILGLTEQSIEKLREMIRDPLLETLKTDMQ